MSELCQVLHPELAGADHAFQVGVTSKYIFFNSKKYFLALGPRVHGGRVAGAAGQAAARRDAAADDSAAAGESSARRRGNWPIISHTIKCVPTKQFVPSATFCC